MSITKLLPVLQVAARNRDALMQDGLDPRAHAQHGARTGVALGKKALMTPLRAWENVPRLIFRGIQFLLGIVLVGIYGNRVDASRRAGESQAPEWMYGLLVAGLSCFTAVLFAVMAPLGAASSKFKTCRLFAWDLALFLLWMVAFGVFAGIFLKRDDEDPYKGASTAVMKGAVWVDLVCAVMWLISGTYGFAKMFLGEKFDSAGDRITGKLFGKFGKKRLETNKTGIYGV